MPTTADQLIRTGVGLRLPHLNEVVAAHPDVAWFEVHPENFIANPHATELLGKVRANYPISIHSVGVSIGSIGGVDRQHLAKVRALVDRIEPFSVSGHLAWSTHAGEYLNDLLPLPYDEETLTLLARHIDEVQDGLGRPYLVENPSSYVGFKGSTMTEVEFLSTLVQRTGCRLLVDVSNIHVSSRNMGYDARAYVDGLPLGAIGELHLGGFEIEPDLTGEEGAEVIVDTHSRPIADAAWDLYAYVLGRTGPRATLIEWDNDLPPLATLLGEAARADVIAASIFPESRHATAR